MKKLLIILLFLPLWTSAQGRPAQQRLAGGSMNYQNRFYQYAAITEGKKWNVELFTVVNQQAKSTNSMSHRIFGTDMYIENEGSKIAKVRIHAAVLLGYSWVVSPYEYLEVRFNHATQKVSYESKGARMSGAYQTEVADKNLQKTFVASKLTQNEAFKIAIQQFIKQADKLLELPDRPRPPQKIIAGTAENDYNYEITRDFYQAGEDNLAIRRDGKGLLSNTLLQIKDEKSANNTISILIHHCDNKGLSWAIYASDYMTAVFDFNTGEINYQQKGQTMPPADETANIIKKFNPKDCTNDQATEIAVRAFLTRHKKAFDKN